MKSTWGERFAFARWWQTGTVLVETDKDFVEALGYNAKSTASNWRNSETAPKGVSERVAKRTGVDPTWLELGERGTGEEPALFAKWLRVQRKARQEPSVAPRVRVDAEGDEDRRRA